MCHKLIYSEQSVFFHEFVLDGVRLMCTIEEIYVEDEYYDKQDEQNWLLNGVVCLTDEHW